MESAPQENVEQRKTDQEFWLTPTHDEMPGVSFLMRHKWLEINLFSVSIAAALLVTLCGWLVCVKLIVEIRPPFLDWFQGCLSLLISYLDFFMGPIWVLFLLLIIGVGSAVVYVASLTLLGLKSAFKVDRWLTMALGMTQATVHAVLVAAATVITLESGSSTRPMSEDELLLIALFVSGSVYLPVPLVVWLMTGRASSTSRTIIVVGFWFSVAMMIAVIGILFTGEWEGWDGILLLIIPSPIALFTLTSGIVWLSTRGLHQRQLKSLSIPTCPACGYDLRGSLVAMANLCPECGERIPARFTAKYAPAER